MLMPIQVRSPLSETTYGIGARLACLVVLDAGRGDVRRDGGNMRFEAPRLFWLAPGAAGELRLSPGSRGEILLLSQGALSTAMPASAFGEEMALLLRTDLSATLGTAQTATTDRMAELRRELGEDAPGAGMMAQHLIAMLMICLWRAAKEGRARPDAVPGGLVQGFIRLAGLHLRDHWQVGDYADALGVTRDRLAAAVRRATGKSPQAWLHEALLREAVQLLTHSGLPVSQVGFRLGFTDPAYFNRFFNRMQGEPPSRYRRRMARRAEPAPSYAAWP
ncbi:helix-turn-helix domain-containing protein [Paracoccus sp. M683]|uniref:helix-turn-helix domain-containing protein n=1 Tax=Paracoccus sp. M683 TaxID=2594268 RepID=UPI00117E97D5|nr:helix-turn-helix domain-containing protein [Paracoccus sp. M683]TRW96519.1 helix-turn-helix domain-containing protein [Paracoccus sp. M683]